MHARTLLLARAAVTCSQKTLPRTSTLHSIMPHLGLTTKASNASTSSSSSQDEKKIDQAWSNNIRKVILAATTVISSAAFVSQYFSKKKPLTHTPFRQKDFIKNLHNARLLDPEITAMCQGLSSSSLFFSTHAIDLVKILIEINDRLLRQEDLREDELQLIEFIVNARAFMHSDLVKVKHLKQSHKNLSSPSSHVLAANIVFNNLTQSPHQLIVMSDLRSQNYDTIDVHMMEFSLINGTTYRIYDPYLGLFVFNKSEEKQCKEQLAGLFYYYATSDNGGIIYENLNVYELANNNPNKPDFTFPMNPRAKAFLETGQTLSIFRSAIAQKQILVVAPPPIPRL